MGAVGTSSGLVNSPTAQAEKYTEFKNNGADKWFANEKDSNMTEWIDGLSAGEKSAINHYTGYGYTDMNKTLYSKPWDEISAPSKKEMANLYNALSKFDLKRGINITRQTDFQIFGKEHNSNMSVNQVKKFLENNGGVLQSDGFMSFGANDHGMSLAGSGLVIHLQVPPSKGAGAYVNPISSHKGEEEFIVNSNSVLRFDPKSVTEMGGKIHVTATWLGQSKMQTIDPKNKSVKK